VRNAFFALLFVNLAYFAWAHWVDAPQPAPANEALTRLPRLKLVEDLPPPETPATAAAQKTALEQPPACFTVGPFGDLANSAKAASVLRAKGFDPRQRAEPGQMTDGYGVFIAGMKSEADTDRTLVTLEHNGIKDAIVIPDGPDAKRLSLGLYSERKRAERRAQAVREMGFKAEVAERKLPGSLYWVDLAPLPGMSTIPLQDLFAEGLGSRIAVQPCPAAQSQATTAAPAPPPGHEAASSAPTQIAGAPRLP
jgi:hypothetical protein